MPVPVNTLPEPPFVVPSQPYLDSRPRPGDTVPNQPKGASQAERPRPSNGHK
ncbi:hypothetical protein BDV93DRAFT_526247 [Ceratobasidium sp. AG-I]|nr:hypothetical protein BDV93DRAFT_526247 [Ceratobasidium sp. AG-I]